MSNRKEPGPSNASRSELGTSELQGFIYYDVDEYNLDTNDLIDLGGGTSPSGLEDLDDDVAKSPKKDTFNLGSFNQPAGIKNSRDYYPLKHHQTMFDAWEIAHPNNPVPGAGGNLTDLQDGDPNTKDGRPPHGLRFIIECAIYGSPEQRLTFREIQTAMVRRFTWFSEHQGWQNSVRHALSRLPDFKKIGRPHKDGDQGAWWVRTSTDPPNVKPFVRSDQRMGPRIPTAGKAGRKPKVQAWSDMTTTLLLPSTSNEGTSSTHVDDAAASTTDHDATQADKDNNEQSRHVLSRHVLAPFVHPPTPESSLPSLSSTGLL